MPWRLNLPRLAACRISGLLLATLLPFAAATWSTARQPRDAGKVKPPADQDAPRQAPFTPDKFLEGIFGQADDDQALAGVDVSRDEESRMGSAAAEAYLADLRRQKLSVATRGKEVDYLRDLVETLRPFMRNRDRYQRIEVHLVDSRQCDARSFPGGTLVFFHGLFDLAESEAALVGVVGHELSHLDHGHQLRDVKRVKLAEQAFTGGIAGGGEAFSPQRLMSIGRTLSAGWARPFRPEDEEQADRDGATWAYQAGYDPRELAALFLKMHRRNEQAAGKNVAGAKGRDAKRVMGPNAPNIARDKDRREVDQGLAAFNFFRTHPFSIDRARAIEERSREVLQPAPTQRLYIGKENLRVRIARVRREFRE